MIHVGTVKYSRTLTIFLTGGLIPRLNFPRKRNEADRKKMLKRIWIYNKDRKPKTILLVTYRKNLQGLNKSGWSDWPYFTPEQFGLGDSDDLDEIGELVKTIQTNLNQAINLDTLDDMELRMFAEARLMKLDALEDAEDLRQRVKDGVG